MLGDECREAVPALEDLRVGFRGASRFPGLARICEAYWEREELSGGEIRFAASVGDVGREGGLSGSQVSKLAGIASVAVLGNTTCPECGGERWATNRTGYHDQIKAEIVGGPCPTCEGRLHWESRGPLSDAELADMERLEDRIRAAEARGRAAQEEEERRREAIYEMSVSNLAAEMPRVEELGLRHAVALAALARVGLSEDLREIRPVLSAEARFAPTPEFGKDLLVELYERGTIMIAPEAPLSAFDFGDNPETDEAYVASWRPLEVDWFAKFADVPEVLEAAHDPDASRLTPEERRRRDSDLGRLGPQVLPPRQEASALSRHFAKALRAGDAGFEGVMPPEGTTLDNLPRALRPTETSAP